MAPPTFSEPNLRNGAWGARPWRTRTPFSPARCASCQRVRERPSPRPVAADSCRSVAALGPLERVSFPAPSCRSADSAPRPLKGWGPCCARSAASRRPSRSRLRGANRCYSRRGLLQSLRGRAYSLFLRSSATDRPRHATEKRSHSKQWCAPRSRACQSRRYLQPAVPTWVVHVKAVCRVPPLYRGDKV